MATLLVLLMLLAVPLTAFTTTDVYYMSELMMLLVMSSHFLHTRYSTTSPTTCISQPDFFTNNTAIIFLEGEHIFDREDLVHVSNVHNLTLKGQGQWPVAGAEKTVMQSTVIINCTRGRGGFYFTTSHSITVEGLTVVNCGGLNNKAVFNFSTVQSLFFQKNSIQHMTGYGLFIHNCGNVLVTNCSYYHSTLCKMREDSQESGGIGIMYEGPTQYNTLELSYSNMTKCCNTHVGSTGRGGGGVSLQTKSGFGSATIFLSHLILSQNSAKWGGGNLAASTMTKWNLLSATVFSIVDMQTLPAMQYIFRSSRGNPFTYVKRKISGYYPGSHN